MSRIRADRWMYLCVALIWVCTLGLGTSGAQEKGKAAAPKVHTYYIAAGMGLRAQRHGPDDGHAV